MRRQPTATWRFGRGWSAEFLRDRLDRLRTVPTNFDDQPDQMTGERGWTIDGCDQVLGFEPPGPPVPHGLFARGRAAVANYDFSDPMLVVGHFDPSAPLLGRVMLLEIKALGLRFLGGVRVGEVVDETGPDRSLFGFRYDTLAGHFERGAEWFRLTKDHGTGEVRFAIQARWQMGDFPNWWSRIGFSIIGELCREIWRRRAIRRMRRLARVPATEPLADRSGLAHRGGDEARRSAPGPG